MALDHSPELWHVQPRRTALLTAVTLALAAGTAWLVARSNPDFEEVISPVQLTVSVVVTLYANATSLLSGTVFPAPLPVVVLLWCVVPNVLGWHLRRRVALRSSEQPRTT
ncbi:MAG: hypothetical protein U0Q19_23810 [Kineosporiaceae bacterium]